jgi:hypothetical protein
MLRESVFLPRSGYWTNMWIVKHLREHPAGAPGAPARQEPKVAKPV